MTHQLIRLLIVTFGLLQGSLTTSCHDSASAERVGTAELTRADGTGVPLVLRATPKPDSFWNDSRAYYVEYNGERHLFASGGFETTYACIAQSPDKNRAAILSAFRGAASGAIEIDLVTHRVRSVDREGRWLKDYQKDGWNVIYWKKLSPGK